MSAPLVVNTRDGVCWTRRTVTSGGIALYAPESVRTCPDFVMATEAELAEHGIVGSAYALPVPVREEPQSRTMLDHARDALRARMSKDDLRLVLENTVTYAASLQARVAELEAELYTEQAHGRTLLEQRNAHAAELLKLRPRVAELEAQTATLRALHVKYEDSDHCQHDGERWPCLTLAALGETGGAR